MQKEKSLGAIGLATLLTVTGSGVALNDETKGNQRTPPNPIVEKGEMPSQNILSAEEKLDLSLYETLKLGDKGPKVIEFKQRMYELGYYKTNKFNDSFRENTKEKVKEFEKKNGLLVDGIADPEMQALFFSNSALKANEAIEITKNTIFKKEETPIMATKIEFEHEKAVIPITEASPKPKDILFEENEKIIIKNILSFLKAESPNTNAEIASQLMKCKRLDVDDLPGWSTSDNIDDLGLILSRCVQGRMLGYLTTFNGENLVLFLGVKDTKKERFVTAVRIPLYAVETHNSEVKLDFITINDLNLHSKRYSERVREKSIATNLLDNQINKNIVAYLYTDKITNTEINWAKNRGDQMKRYVNEMKNSIYYARGLNYLVYRNNINLEFKESEYTKHKVDVWKVSDISDVNNNLFNNFYNGEINNIPISLAYFYSTID